MFWVRFGHVALPDVLQDGINALACTDASEGFQGLGFILAGKTIVQLGDLVVFALDGLLRCLILLARVDTFLAPTTAFGAWSRSVALVLPPAT